MNRSSRAPPSLDSTPSGCRSSRSIVTTSASQPGGTSRLASVRTVGPRRRARSSAAPPARRVDGPARARRRSPAPRAATRTAVDVQAVNPTGHCGGSPSLWPRSQRANSTTSSLATSTAANGRNPPVPPADPHPRRGRRRRCRALGGSPASIPGRERGRILLSHQAPRELCPPAVELAGAVAGSPTSTSRAGPTRSSSGSRSTGAATTAHPPDSRNVRGPGHSGPPRVRRRRRHAEDRQVPHQAWSPR